VIHRVHNENASEDDIWDWLEFWNQSKNDSKESVCIRQNMKILLVFGRERRAVEWYIDG
jgi:hypothetical protein